MQLNLILFSFVILLNFSCDSENSQETIDISQGEQNSSLPEEEPKPGTIALNNCPTEDDLCISGTILLDLADDGNDVPIEGVTVEIEDDPTINAVTTSAGTFTIAIPSEEENSDTLLSKKKNRREEYKSKSFNVIGRYEKDGKKYAKRIPNLTFLGGNTLDLGKLRLKRTGAIQGTVTLSDGESPLGIDVYIPGTSFTAKASDKGSFIILYIPAGKYDLIYEKQGYHFKSESDILVRSKLATYLDKIELQPVVVDTIPPQTPNLIPLAGGLTNDPSPILSWSKNDEDTALYELQVDSLSSFNSSNLRKFSNIKLTKQEVVPQLNDGLWYYRVRAIDYSGNKSEWSTALNFRIDTQAVGIPVTKLFPTPTNDTTPTFSWEMVTGASSYHIIVSKDEDFQDIVIDTKDPSSITFTPTDPLSDRLYFWKAASIDNAGNSSAFSLPKSFEIDSSIPSSPSSDQHASPTQDNTPTITWSAVTGISKYRIQIDDSSLFTSPVVDDASLTTTSYTSSTLSDGRWYYRIASIDNANNKSGFSVYKEFVIDTTAPNVATLVDFTPNPTNDKTPLFRWTAGGGAPVSWDVEIDDSSDFSSPLQAHSGLTSTQLQVSSLLPTATIYWRVRQVDEAGNSGSWSSSNFVIQDAATTKLKYDFNLVSTVNTTGAYSVALRNGIPIIAIQQSDGRFRISKWSGQSYIEESSFLGVWNEIHQLSPTGDAIISTKTGGPSLIFNYEYSTETWKMHYLSSASKSSFPADIIRDNGSVYAAISTKHGINNPRLRFVKLESDTVTEEEVDGIDQTGFNPRIIVNNNQFYISYRDATESVYKIAIGSLGNWVISDLTPVSGSPFGRLYFDGNDLKADYRGNILTYISDNNWINNGSSGISVTNTGGNDRRFHAINEQNEFISCGSNSSDFTISTTFKSLNIEESIHSLNTSKCHSASNTSYGSPLLLMEYTSYVEHYVVSSYPITSVDATSTNVGHHTSLKFYQSNPRISYYDASNLHLKYTSSNGETWSVDTVDNSSQVGEFSSLAQYSDGDPGIAYYDANLGNLKYAFNDNSAGWTLEVVDNSTNVGKFTSTELNSSDHPRISYYDVDNGNLKYAAFDGSSWNIATVDSSSDVGQYSDLKLQPTSEYPSIAYFDVTSSSLKYAQYNGTTWDVEIVDSTDSVGEYASLELRSDGDPVVLYYDSTNKKLKIAEKDSGSWTIETVTYTPKSPAPGSTDYGMYSDLVIESDNDLHISFYDTTNTNLVYGYCDGSNWQFKIADGANVESGNVVGESNIDFTGNVGKWTSIQLKPNNGAPSVSYFDESEGILKYVEGVVLY